MLPFKMYSKPLRLTICYGSKLLKIMYFSREICHSGIICKMNQVTEKAKNLPHLIGEAKIGFVLIYVERSCLHSTGGEKKLIKK